MSKGKVKPAKDIKWLGVSDLHVSKLNMRHGKTAPDIDDVYPSILEGGVHQSLLVRKEGKSWGVIAGRRRLFALQKRAKDLWQAQIAPCLIMESGNVKAAREALLLENAARVPAIRPEFIEFGVCSQLARVDCHIACRGHVKEKFRGFQALLGHNCPIYHPTCANADYTW